MSIDVLPTEILLEIFKNTTGVDVAICRRVCKRWKNVIDGLSDDKWKQYCLQDHHDGPEPYKRAKLTWKELYKSLHLWNKIASADMRVYSFPFRPIQHFQTLKGSVLAVCENNSNNIINLLWGYSDTIVYYDLETYKEIDRMNFDFSFTSYKENEYLICVIDQKGRLCVIPKETKEFFFVGKLPLYFEFGHSVEYTLCSDKVYFQTEDKIYVAKLKKKKNGTITVKTVEFDDFVDQIVAFSVFQSKDSEDCTVYVLVDELIKGTIYEYKNGDAAFVGEISKYDEGMMIYELQSFGFEWTDPSILNWLVRTFDARTLQISKLKFSSICRFGTTIVLGTMRKTINIYANPYTPFGELKLYNAKPDKTIDLNEIYKPAQPLREIEAIDVVEIKNGHKIIVLADDNLNVLEFYHGEERGPKRQNYEEYNGHLKRRKICGEALPLPKTKCRKRKIRTSKASKSIGNKLRKQAKTRNTKNDSNSTSDSENMLEKQNKLKRKSVSKKTLNNTKTKANKILHTNEKKANSVDRLKSKSSPNKKSNVKSNIDIKQDTLIKQINNGEHRYPTRLSIKSSSSKTQNTKTTKVLTGKITQRKTHRPKKGKK